MTRAYDIEKILWPDTPFPLDWYDTTIMRRGSEAQGTYIPSTDPDSIDDRDIMGVVIPPASYYIGLDRWEGAESIKGEWDVVLYEYRKFVGLLMKQNPNVIGMLYLRPEDYLAVHPSFTMLIDNRDLFQHRDMAYDSFVGYATAQLKKMTSGAFKGYMGARRKELVERHGYDCKNAAHLVRLLHMGIEYLETGELTVYRTKDREMLVDIKKGKWKLEEVQKYAESLFDDISKAKAGSSMSNELDSRKINQLVVAELKHALWG